MPKAIVKEAMVKQDRCHRCGGMMVSEQVYGMDGEVRRCVMCGERVDPVILANRRQKVARAKAEKLFSAPGSVTLN